MIIEERRFCKRKYIEENDVSVWNTDSKHDGENLGVLALWK